MLNKKKLNPDGVDIKISWASLNVTDSVFIPCINTNRARRQVLNIVKELDMRVKIVVCSSNGYLGIRVWRTL